MEIFGIDLSLLPWPIFLLTIFIFFGGIWFVQVHLPMSEELEDLKTNQTNKLELLNNKIGDTHSDILKIFLVLEQIQKDQNGIANKYDNRLSPMEDNIRALSVELAEILKTIRMGGDQDVRTTDRHMMKLDDIKEKLLLLIAYNSKRDS